MGAVLKSFSGWIKQTGWVRFEAASNSILFILGCFAHWLAPPEKSTPQRQRGSAAKANNVWIPPSELPMTTIRAGSISSSPVT